MNTTSQPTRTLSGFELARIVASWLPTADEQRALKMIERHEREHKAAERVTKLLAEQSGCTRM